MNKRLVILIVLMMFTFVGCSKNGEPNIPKLKVTYNNEDIEVVQGGYKWSSKVGLFNKKAVIADSKSPDQIADDIDGNKVSPKAKLDLKFTIKPDNIKVLSWRNDYRKEYALTNRTITTPKEEGTYIFEIIGEWAEGSVSYVIKVVV